jgi:hypothetical protein
MLTKRLRGVGTNATGIGTGAFEYLGGSAGSASRGIVWRSPRDKEVVISMTCVPCCLLGIGAIEEFTAFRLHCRYVLARMDSIGSVGGHCKKSSSLRRVWDREGRPMHSPAAKPEKAMSTYEMDYRRLQRELLDLEEAFEQGIRLILHQTSRGLDRKRRRLCPA